MNKRTLILICGAIAVLLIVGFLVLPALLSPFGLAVYAKDSAGGKHYLTQPGWTAGGVAATAVGADYTWTSTGDLDEIKFTFTIYECTTVPEHAPTYTEVPGSTLSATTGLADGADVVEWHLDNYFAAYKDGAAHSFMIKGTAQGYADGQASGELLVATGTFFLQWETGTLTGFTITPSG